MKKYKIDVAVARDGTKFTREQNDNTNQYLIDCENYEERINRNLVKRVIGHVRFFSRQDRISRMIQLENGFDVFYDYEDLYVRILDEEGVALATEYCFAMQEFYVDSGELFTNDDIGQTVRLYYNEGRGRWMRYNETLEEMITRHQKTLATINKFSTDPIFDNRLFVTVEGIY